MTSSYQYRPFQGQVELTGFKASLKSKLPNAVGSRFLDKGTQIRLLKLEPGAWEETVRCSLSTVRLESNPRFEALSYHWGDPSIRENILCANKGFSITKNLFDALKAFRLVGRPRILWADAICINQNDDTEKGAQIRIMGRIYSSASKVLVWLGKSREEDDIAIGLLKSLAHREMLSSSVTVDIGIGETIDLKEWRALAGFLSREWFSRIWVIQEVALGKIIELFAGDRVIEWDMVQKAISVIAQQQMGSLLFYDHAMVALCCLGQMGRRRAHAIENHMTTPREKDRPIGRAQTSILRLLYGLSDFNATNPVDMLYGVFGLADSEDIASFPIDCSASVEHVYTEFTAWYLEKFLDLTILSCANHVGMPPELAFNMPSWVVDWRWAQSTPSLQDCYFFRACGKAPSGLKIDTASNGKKILRLRARLCDRLSRLGSLPALASPSTANMPFPSTLQGMLNSSPGYVQHRIREAFDMAFAKFEDAKYESYFASALTDEQMERIRDMGMEDAINKPMHARYQEYWRTVICDMNAGGERAMWAYRDYGSDWIKFCLDAHPSGDPQPDIAPEPAEWAGDMIWDRKMEAAVVRWTAGRKFCVTEQDRLGWVPFSAQRDDLIAVINGIKVPMVIRKDGDGNTYRLVGECYIHGLMEGEAMLQEDLKRQDIILV